MKTAGRERDGGWKGDRSWEREIAERGGGKRISFFHLAISVANRVCVCVCVFSQAPRTSRPTPARWWPLIERARRRGPVFPWRGIHGTGSSALVGRADACKQPCKQPAVGVVSSRQVAGGLGKVAGQGGTRTPSSPPPSLGGGAGW